MFSCTMSLHFLGECHIHRSQSCKELDIWAYWESNHYISYLDADAVLCGASNCGSSDLCSLTRYVS